MPASEVRFLLRDSIAATADSSQVRHTLTDAEKAQPIDFAVTLKMRNFDGLKARVHSHQLASPDEMEAQYLPSAADYASVAAWFVGQGFSVMETDKSHTNLFLRGTVAQVITSLGVTFARVKTSDGEFSSAVTAPALPQRFSGCVLGIVGLQPHLRMHSPRQEVVRPDALGTVNNYFSPADILAAYNAPTNLDGTGQTIAIVMAAAPNQSDLTAFYKACGITELQPNYTVTNINGGPTPSSQTSSLTEVTLDAEWATAMAPGAKLIVYATPDLNLTNVLAAFTQALNDGKAKIVSHSAGGTEYSYPSSTLASYSQSLVQLANAGITVMASSGDGGSNPYPPTSSNNGYSASNPLAVDYPASDPEVIGVGGTNLSFNSSWVGTGESAWTPGTTPPLSGTGGGVSSVFVRPSWQTGSGVPAGSARCVPDLAMVATANEGSNTSVGGFVIVNGAPAGVNGTSLACPIFAGMTALIDEHRSQLGLPEVGLLGPLIYALIGTTSFNDVTTGNNGAYSAGAGYDLCTGIGAPNVSNLMVQIDEEISFVSPPTSAVNLGASVSIQAISQLTSTYQWYLNGVAIAGATSSSYQIASATAASAGSYTVTITNAEGAVTYLIGTLNVNSPPVISVQPASQTVLASTTATLSVTADGFLPLSYQWYFNGAPIGGATSSSYSLADVQTTSTGTYIVIVTDTKGSVTSSPATLNVNPAPVITTQPALTQTVALGATFFVSAAAMGTPPPTVQWYLNNVAISSGGTSNTIGLNASAPAYGGVYTAVYTNPYGTATSNGALVAITAPGGPSITTQPLSQTVTSGSTVAFSVAATAATSYQWYFDGNAVSGATGTQLVVFGATAATAGSYNCFVANAQGSAVTATATLALTTTSNPGRLVNLSMISDITGSLSMGFVIGGAGATGSETLLVRAVGPTLGAAPFNYPGIMPDPTLTITQQSNHATIGTDAGWDTPPSNGALVTAADNATGAFALSNPASLDSALVETLPLSPGGYSAVVAGKSGDSGNALTEVYDDTPNYTTTSPRLVNLSCLTTIPTGGSIGVGFVIGGSTAKTVLIRAGGPVLTALFGIGGAMPDPLLQVTPLSSGTTILASNAGWGGTAALVNAAAAVGAFAYPSASSADSVVLLTLTPGGYTAHVSGVSGDGGGIIVEIYEVP